MTAEIIILRIVHILGGTFWVGSALFTTFFLVPALAASGPAAGEVMVGLQRRRLFAVLPIVALLTILSGIRLMWITSEGFASYYFQWAGARMFAAAGVASVVAFIIAMVERSRGRTRAGTLITVALLVASAAGMAIARYLR